MKIYRKIGSFYEVCFIWRADHRTVSSESGKNTYVKCVIGVEYTLTAHDGLSLVISGLIFVSCSVPVSLQMQISYGTQKNAHTVTRINAGRQTLLVASNSFPLCAMKKSAWSSFVLLFEQRIWVSLSKPELKICSCIRQLPEAFDSFLSYRNINNIVHCVYIYIWKLRSTFKTSKKRNFELYNIVWKIMAVTKLQQVCKAMAVTRLQ
jgi:hypothetical protein